MADPTKTYYLVGFLNEDCSAILLEDANILSRILRQLKGLRLEIRIGKIMNQRSAAQNRYWWGVLVPSAIQFHKEIQGVVYEKDEMHGFLCQEVLGYRLEMRVVDGKEIWISKMKRTSSMNTVEFGEAIETVWAYYDERGWYIHPPSGNNYLNDFVKRDK